MSAVLAARSRPWVMFDELFFGTVAMPFLIWVRATRPGRHPAAVPVRGRRLRETITRHRQPLAVRRLGPGSSLSTPPPRRCSTGSCTTAVVVARKARATACAKPKPEDGAEPRAPERSTRPHPSSSTPVVEDAHTGLQRPVLEPTRGGDLRWPPAGTSRWPLTASTSVHRPC